ncbi:hypothetical protein V5799_015933 [Amblyomma americanum]|uniref:Uncharacterized protein n=1 Tax=Amblyomma americanum TaxID=6943 RepID=A0AAQ4F6K6_AMBAM
MEEPQCVVNAVPTLSRDVSYAATTSVLPGHHMSMLEAVKRRRLCLQIVIVSLLLVGILAISSLAFYFLIMLRREIAV